MGTGAAHLLTVGHGTLSEDDLRRLLLGAGVRLVVDVRRLPGSSRHPQVGRAALEGWLPEAGIAYRWCEPLGGRRTPLTGSPLVRGCDIDHLGHDGRRTPHPLTDTAHRLGSDVRYAVDPTPELPWSSGSAFT